jgi:hypothetical protein
MNVAKEAASKTRETRGAAIQRVESLWAELRYYHSRDFYFSHLQAAASVPTAHSPGSECPARASDRIPNRVAVRSERVQDRSDQCPCRRTSQV